MATTLARFFTIVKSRSDSSSSGTADQSSGELNSLSDLSKTKQSPSPLQQDHQPKSTKEDKAVLPKYKVSSAANVEQENEEVKYEDFVKDLRGDNKLAKETIQESKITNVEDSVPCGATVEESGSSTYSTADEAFINSSQSLSQSDTQTQSQSVTQTHSQCDTQAQSQSDTQTHSLSNPQIVGSPSDGDTLTKSEKQTKTGSLSQAKPDVQSGSVSEAKSNSENIEDRYTEKCQKSSLRNFFTVKSSVHLTTAVKCPSPNAAGTTDELDPQPEQQVPADDLKTTKSLQTKESEVKEAPTTTYGENKESNDEDDNQGLDDTMKSTDDMRLAYDNFVSMVREGTIKIDEKTLIPRVATPESNSKEDQTIPKTKSKVEETCPKKKAKNEEAASKTEPKGKMKCDEDIGVKSNQKSMNSSLASKDTKEDHRDDSAKSNDETDAPDEASSQNTTVLSFSQTPSESGDHCWSQSTIVSNTDENNPSLDTTLQDESFSQMSAHNDSLSQRSDASDSSKRVSLREVRRRLKEKQAASPDRNTLPVAQESEEKPVKKRRGRPPKAKSGLIKDSNVTEKAKDVKLTEISTKKSVNDVTASPKRQLRTRRTLKSVEEDLKTECLSDKQSDSGAGTKDNPLTLFSDEDCSLKIQPVSASSSTHSSPITSRVKRRQRKACTPSSRLKKRKISESSAATVEDDDIVMVTEVSSPGKALREERLAKLAAMSNKSDHDNLKRGATVIPLSQAQLFPTIPHITQLHNQDEEDDCKLKLKESVFEPISPICDRLHLDTTPENVVKVKQSKASVGKVKRELKRLIDLLPQYPVSDVYQALELIRCESSQDQLWTSKYCPTSSDHLLVSKEHIDTVNEWLLMWKRDINRGQTHQRNPQAKKKKKRKALGFINDGESGDEGTDEVSHRTPILVISGEPGLGKTTCVYAMSSSQDFKVFEINPSVLRTTKTIMETVHESTQSQRVLKGKGISIDQMFDNLDKETKKKTQASAIKSFFANVKTKKKPEEPTEDKNSVPAADDQSSKKRRGRKRDISESSDTQTDDDTTSTASSSEDKLSLSKLSLIFFDEADIAFEDDKGFHDTIRILGQQAKKPIILTCQSTRFLKSLDVEYTHVHMTPYLNSEVAAYLCLICLVEGEVSDYIAMLDLVNKYKCDIRKCIHHIQYLVSSGGLVKNNKQRNKKPSKGSASEDENSIQNLCKAYRHQTAHDMISTHHTHKLSGNRHFKPCLHSNRACLTEEPLIQTTVLSTPVLWSGVHDIKHYYSSVIRDTYSIPTQLKYDTRYLKPEVSELALSLRGALCSPYSDITDEALSSDYTAFSSWICSAEEARKESKISRRFLHFLDKSQIYMTDEEKLELSTLFQSTDNT